MEVKKGESGHNGGAANAGPDCTGQSGTALFAECFKDLGLPEISAARSCKVSQGFGSPGDLRGPYLILLAFRKLRPTTNIIIEALLHHD